MWCKCNKCPKFETHSAALFFNLIYVNEQILKVHQDPFFQYSRNFSFFSSSSFAHFSSKIFNSKNGDPFYRLFVYLSLLYHKQNQKIYAFLPFVHFFSAQGKTYQKSKRCADFCFSPFSFL